MYDAAGHDHKMCCEDSEAWMEERLDNVAPLNDGKELVKGISDVDAGVQDVFRTGNELDGDRPRCEAAYERPDCRRAAWTSVHNDDEVIGANQGLFF